MANLTAERYDTLQEMLKVITEARQASERLSEIWAKGLANPIGPHTIHLSSPITPMTPSQSPQPPDPVMIPEKTANKSDPFIEPLERASVLQVVGSISDVMLVHKVDSHVKEVEELSQKSTNGNGESVAHQLFDQKPVRITNKEKHLKHLKGWKFKFKGKNLSRVMPRIGQYELMERKCKGYNKFSSNIQIEPMRTKISWEHWRAGKRQRISPFQLRYDTRSYLDVFLPIWLRDETQEKQHTGLSRAERIWKPGELVFLRKQWAWLSIVHNRGIIVNLARRLCGTNLSTKLFSPPLTDFQNWKKELGSLTLCSNIGLEEWIRGLEIYGCETKKHMLLLVKLANRVWDCGGSPLECVDESSCYVKSSEEAVTVLEARPQLLNTFLLICEYNKVDNSWACNDRQKGAVCDAEYKNLLNIEAGAKKGTNSCLGGKIAVALARKKRLRNVKAAGCLCDLDQVNSLDEEEFMGFTEFSKLQLAMEFLLLNSRIFMNTRLLHDKINSVFVALRVALTLLVVFEYIKAIRTRYEKAEKVDKHKINFTGKFAESIIVAMLDEHEDIETACVLSRMSLNGGTHTLAHLVKDYDDGRRITWFKLTLNSVSQQTTGSAHQSSEVQRETNWNDVTQTEAIWGAQLTSLGYVENSLAEFYAYEVYHPPRPPELLRYKEDEESTAIGSVSAIIGDNEAKAQKFSSLRTRMCSSREYCDRINDPGFLSLVFLISIM